MGNSKTFVIAMLPTQCTEQLRYKFCVLLLRVLKV